MKKWVKRLGIGFGVLLIIFLLANFGLNIWLKTQLPNYIKKNTDYKVSYKTLDVDLGSGTIISTGVTVNSKNPQNVNVIGIQGTIDTLKINRFGIYDALFNKTISSSDLLLAQPNLNIILAKPIDQKTGKKRNPIMFENIRINNGNINIFRYTKQKFLGVKRFNLLVENLQMTEESVENKLPIVFDRYDIKGEDFFFRPDNIYALKIDRIITNNKQVLFENFKWVPLLTVEQLKKFYPEKNKIFRLDVQKLEFKNIILKDNKVSLTNANFQRPILKVYTTASVVKKVKKAMNYEVNLEHIHLSNGAVQVMKPDGGQLLNAPNLNLNINQLAFDKTSSENIIPVNYKDFNFSGKNIHYTDKQNIVLGSVALNPKSGEIRNMTVLPTDSKTGMDFKTNHIAFNINRWEFIDKKLNLDIKDILVDGVDGTIKERGKIVSKQKTELKEIQFPLVVRKVVLKNSNITYEKENQPLTFNDLNATVNGIELKPKENNNGLGIDVKDYTLSTKNFSYTTKFYQMGVRFLKIGKNTIEVDHFAMKPLVSRAQFIKMIPVESDLYDLKVDKITADGHWDLFSDHKVINASHMIIQSADANIFRSKIPKDDPKEKPLYSRMLRSIKIPMYVNSLDVKDSKLVYEEDTPESSGPGKLTFGQFNMNVKNLNSNKLKGKPTQVQAKIDCSFMNLAPLSVNWSFDVANPQDIFTIAGKVVQLPAEGINPFIRPYLHITATGTIQEMLFNFKGNPKGLGGTFNLKHKDLKIAILNKKNKEKKGFLTTLANLFIKTNSGQFPESVTIDKVERDPTKSFFNLFWKGIQEGLKKTLIGIGTGKAEKAVKKTASAVKEIKSSIKETRSGNQ